MTDGEKGLGLLIALMGANLGRSHTSQYGIVGNASPSKILKDKDVRYILELDKEDDKNEN